MSAYHKSVYFALVASLVQGSVLLKSSPANAQGVPSVTQTAAQVGAALDQGAALWCLSPPPSDQAADEAGQAALSAFDLKAKAQVATAKSCTKATDSGSGAHVVAASGSAKLEQTNVHSGFWDDRLMLDRFSGTSFCTASEVRDHILNKIDSTEVLGVSLQHVVDNFKSDCGLDYPPESFLVDVLKIRWKNSPTAMVDDGKALQNILHPSQRLEIVGEVEGPKADYHEFAKALRALSPAETNVNILTSSDGKERYVVATQPGGTASIFAWGSHYPKQDLSTLSVVDSNSGPVAADQAATARKGLQALLDTSLVGIHNSTVDPIAAECRKGERCDIFLGLDKSGTATLLVSNPARVQNGLIASASNSSGTYKVLQFKTKTVSYSRNVGDSAFGADVDIGGPVSDTAHVGYRQETGLGMMTVGVSYDKAHQQSLSLADSLAPKVGPRFRDGAALAGVSFHKSLCGGGLFGLKPCN